MTHDPYTTIWVWIFAFFVAVGVMGLVTFLRAMSPDAQETRAGIVIGSGLCAVAGIGLYVLSLCI